MKVFKVEIELVSYIAHPYWPAKNRVIEIEKKSGVNRQKSEEKREAALKAECERQGTTLEAYRADKIAGAQHWYREPQQPDGIIYIPRHQIHGGLVQVIGGAPKALRGPFDRDNFRALVDVSNFLTEHTSCSGIFGRFAKLEGSNQRNYQENEFLGKHECVRANKVMGEPFVATGRVTCDPKYAETVRALFTALVELVGLGAARKMGFGRGKILRWQ